VVVLNVSATVVSALAEIQATINISQQGGRSAIFSRPDLLYNKKND